MPQVTVSYSGIWHPHLHLSTDLGVCPRPILRVWDLSAILNKQSDQSPAPSRTLHPCLLRAKDSEFPVSFLLCNPGPLILLPQNSRHLNLQVSPKELGI